MLGIREEVNTCTGDQAEVREVAWVDENSDEVREVALPGSTRIVTRTSLQSATEEGRVYPSPQHSPETEEVMTNSIKSKRKI